MHFRYDIHHKATRHENPGVIVVQRKRHGTWHAE